ncbi:phage holin family protein [Frankia sp. AgB1.9]|nr:phage holin family protein [Frankia sp. AgW1.1]MBL7487765.1 phage holin family protein [Frankia sp. AgW1.1]MBL7547993.1 phage holin family protein [Frankia sp. AgB1.9]MBL7622718.1 phage holin family protein [Frankia sp. AgB1.8]
MTSDISSATGAPRDASVGRLVGRLSEQVSHLVHGEMALAETELKRKGAKAAAGGGLFGGAAVVGVFGVGTLVACAVLGLATVLSAWLASLIVAAALLLTAGVLALAGKKDLQAATPPLPTDAINSVKQDIHTVAEATRR